MSDLNVDHVRDDDLASIYSMGRSELEHEKRILISMLDDLKLREQYRKRQLRVRYEEHRDAAAKHLASAEEKCIRVSTPELEYEISKHREHADKYTAIAGTVAGDAAIIKADFALKRQRLEALLNIVSAELEETLKQEQTYCPRQPVQVPASHEGLHPASIIVFVLGLMVTLLGLVAC